jgi:ribosomal protein S18 acetylase RimI-like enzyme
MKMKIVSRRYNRDEDFTLIMSFLSRTYADTQSYQNWFPDRFENSHERWINDIRIWEQTDDSTSPPKVKIIALANPESKNHYFIQIDPPYSFIEQEIIEWIEKQCLEKKQDSNKSETLKIISVKGNKPRENLLIKLGYQKEEIAGFIRVRPLDLSIPEFLCPNGFRIRNVKDSSDYTQLAALIRLIFGHGEWFNTGILEEIAESSFYKKELDLVAVEPNGKIVSFCTFRMDPVSKITNLEPMGTHPDYRRLGLAKALIAEGLKRTMMYKPSLFYIGGAANTPAANQLYESTGYTEKIAEISWVKKI